MTPQEYAAFWGAPNTEDYSNNKAAAYDTFKQVFGRAPTRDEANQILPAFGNDPHIPNTQAGSAFISQLHNSTENTPDKLYAKQQAEYKQNAPQHYDTVNKLFQNAFGHAPSQEELDHFGSELASGQVDAYQIQQFLQQQPEYVNKQNEQMREGLSGKMAANDRRQFSEQILPSIQEAYAKQGRSFDSSAFSNSAALAAQAQNTQRENFLSNLTAQQYGGVQDRAYNDYANMLAQQQNLTNSGIQAQYSQIQGAQNRSNDLADLNTQNQMYQQYLARYGKRGGNGIMGSLQGAIGGATLGAKFGPWGALAGGVAGGGLGYAGSQGGSY